MTFNGESVITSADLVDETRQSTRFNWVLINTYNRGELTVGATDGVGVAAGAAGVVSDDGAVFAVLLVPAMAPPMMAAATITVRTTVNNIQKFRRRSPHIFRGLGSGGGTGTTSAIEFVFTSKS